MWSLRTAQTRAEPIWRESLPALVINADADTGVFPIAQTSDALASETNHVRHQHRSLLHDAGGTSEQADTIKWIAKRWR